MAEQPVIDLDDSFENRNWLRVVAESPPGMPREEAVQAIKDREAPAHTPRSIFLHDTIKEETED